MARRKKTEEDEYRLMPALVIPMEEDMINDIARICKIANVEHAAFARQAIKHVIDQLHGGQLHLTKRDVVKNTE